MHAIPTEQYPSGKLPCHEQLNRFRRLGTHLKRFLSRYSCEPQTRERFLQREALKEQLSTLEERCRQVSHLSSPDSVLGRIGEELVQLNREFKQLEARIYQYMQEASA